MEHVLEEREFEKDGFIYKVKYFLDVDADLDHLGKFSDTWQEGAIEHSEGSRYYRYFIPANPEYGQQEYKRMMEYERGYWSMIGVVAEIYLKDKNYPVARSYGLWGVEDDGGKEYLKEIEEEQIEDAEAELRGIKGELCPA